MSRFPGDVLLFLCLERWVALGEAAVEAKETKGVAKGIGAVLVRVQKEAECPWV